MNVSTETKSAIYPFKTEHFIPKQPSPLVVQLDEQPIEGGEHPVHGNVTWRTLFSADRTPTSELLLGVAEFPANGVLNLHRHEPAEFYMCLSGSGVVTVDGTSHSVNAGSAVFIPGNSEHGVVAGGEGLTFIYGFAQDSFADIHYIFSASTPEKVIPVNLNTLHDTDLCKTPIA